MEYAKHNVPHKLSDISNVKMQRHFLTLGVWKEDKHIFLKT